ncbi:GTP-binding protein [Candidatus Woesearchaeota archaeon]|nr:GTP-binding protein [Candidatus Woesearchaeota archaeon]
MSHKSLDTEKIETSSDLRKKIKDFEEELSKTKYNKRTQHHVGLVKAKIAKLKEKEEKRAKGKGKTTGYSLKKTGDATVVMLGFPSVGKSTLLNKLTNAESKVAAYEFTTLEVIPGMMEYNGAKIQIFDIPGIVTGAASGKGRGKEVLSVIRGADLIIVMVDAQKPKQAEILANEVYESGIRLNQKKPDVKITKKPFGGVGVAKTVKLKLLDDQTIKDMAKELGLINADLLIRSEINADQLIDVIEANKVYIPGLVVMNKADLVEKEKLEKIKKDTKADICISAQNDSDFEKVKALIFQRLGLIRIYLKEVNKEPDLKDPLIMREGCTVRDICVKLHRDFLNKFRFARVWGKTARFPGQTIRRLDKVLHDRDIFEIHLG